MSEGTAGMPGDVLISGGEVIDGTGAPRRRADVRVRHGRVAEIGASLAPEGEQRIDANGAVVTPGFIDTHAHTDPAVFWDPFLDPEPLHGVTTMLTGNCSLSLFPVSEATRSDVSDLFSYIEDVPRYLFDDSVPWTWEDFAGYRDVVNAAGAGANLAPLVGHSMLRLVVMGADAWERAATAGERAAMAGLFAASVRQGAWGLSVSALDVDSQGREVPSRRADGAELDALLAVLRDAGRGVVEYVPNLFGSQAEAEFTTLARRCGAHGVPLTWTGFAYSTPASTGRWLDLTRRLAGEGVRSYPQLSPRTVDFRLNWESSMMFMTMPSGWHKVIAAARADKPALLRDPGWRAAAREEWDRTEHGLFPHRNLQKVRIVETRGSESQRWLGRTLQELVEEQGGHPSDVFADFVLANDCRPGIVAVGVANSDVAGVGRTLTDPAVIVSSSDAGAHMQMLCASGDSTLLLTRHVAERGDFTLEEAVYQLTGRQAALFGFTGRGEVRPGAVADLAVFALDELHYGGDGFVRDLPGGGARLRRPDGGYRATVVAGVPVQLAGTPTGALPGRVISAGDS